MREKRGQTEYFVICNKAEKCQEGGSQQFYHKGKIDTQGDTGQSSTLKICPSRVLETCSSEKLYGHCNHAFLFLS